MDTLHTPKQIVFKISLLAAAAAAADTRLILTVSNPCTPAHCEYFHLL